MGHGSGRGILKFNLTLSLLLPALKSHPEKPALVVCGPDRHSQTYTYQELAAGITRAWSQLDSLGFPSGARIVIGLPQGFDFVTAFFAVMLGGWVAVPISPQLTPGEVDFVMADAAAHAIIAAADRWEKLPPNCQRISLERKSSPTLLWQNWKAITRANDPAFMVYTSGTTGTPKAVVHAQRFLLGRKPMFSGWTGIGSEDVVLHAGELNWTYTFGVGLMDPWVQGATAVIGETGRRPEAWLPLIEQHQVTVFAAVPALYRRILKYSDVSKFNGHTLRHGLSAGEVLPPGILHAWQEKIRRPIYEALGMSEISTFISNHKELAVVAGSCGKPQSGRRVAILPVEGGEKPLPAGEVGLIAVDQRDPGLMLGYVREGLPKANLRGNWFVTQDLAVCDAEGRFWYAGRNDDVIKCLGYRISPLEVETVLEQHPKVQEAAVSLVRKGDLDLTVAYVVAKENNFNEQDGQAILAFAAERLAAYKVPKEVRLVDSLPRGPNGKLQRKKLGGDES